MRNPFKTISQRVRRIIADFRDRNADRDMALLDTDSEYAASQRNEPINPETLAEVFENPNDQFSREDEYYDERNPEYICIKCRTREAILNSLCGMCSELHPNLV